MRILSLFKPCINQTERAMQDIAHLKNLFSDTKIAYKRGVAVSEYRNLNKTNKIGYISKVTYQKGIKQHLPGLFACVLSPLPCGSVGGYGLGKFLQRLI